jgi:hypothetical protein
MSIIISSRNTSQGDIPMIMEWKRKAVTEYHAYWHGVQYVLYENHSTGRWHMTANGALVKQNWSTQRVAMKDMEERQTRIVLAAAVALATRKGAALATTH